MNPADQIDAVVRRGIGQVLEAARLHALEQERLRAELAAQQAATPTARLRADLEHRAQLADNATPRLLLPAEVADASPHSGPRPRP